MANKKTIALVLAVAAAGVIVSEKNLSDKIKSNKIQTKCPAVLKLIRQGYLFERKHQYS